MVNPKMLERVREELLEKRDELQGKVSRTALRMKDGSDRLADFVDQAAVEHEQTVELVISGRQSDQIREIQATILRIDQGRFGVCSRCGREISPKRLLLAPLSRLCTTCKQRMELSSRAGCRPVSGGVDRYAC